MKSPGKNVAWLLALATTLTLAPAAYGQTQTYGSSNVGLSPTPPITAPISPTAVFQKSTYVTGGTSLRNRAAGNINIVGLPAAASYAYVYWAVICSGACPTPSTMIQIQRLLPTVSAVAVVPGVVVGTGPAPCWGGGDTLYVFRASVSNVIVNGNGDYQVNVLAGGQAIVNWSSPWSGFAVPAWEGASLVVIAPSATGGTVSLFDAKLAGTMFTPVFIPLNYTLTLPVNVSSNGTYFDNIGADGQHWVPRGAVASVGDEVTRINGLPIAGPGSQYNDSDWNGSAGLPMTELWDDTAHDITAAATAGNLLNVNISAGAGAWSDCLSTVANVVQEN